MCHLLSSQALPATSWHGTVKCLGKDKQVHTPCRGLQVHFEGRSKVFRFETAFFGDDEETLIIRPLPVTQPQGTLVTPRVTILALLSRRIACHTAELQRDYASGES